MLRSVFVTLFSLFSCLHVFSQNTSGSISGKVVDSAQRSLEGATVFLVTGPKDVPVKSALTDDNGIFVLEKIKWGSYKVIISMTGFNKEAGIHVILSEEKNNASVGTVKLVTLSKELQGVTVTGQRAALERKIDRTVVNVDQMVSAAGSTALDVLERSPGVSVDNNGVISLQGKNGVIIFFDDKPTYLSGADLENYLRS